MGPGGPVLQPLVGILFWIARLLHDEERQRARVAVALERNTMLPRDVHHLFKNNLASVVGLVDASSAFRQAGSSEAGDHLEAVSVVATVYALFKDG